MSGSRPLVAVLDYGIGNLRSAQRALEHAGADARLDADGAVAERADAVVLPGVGAFGACVKALRDSGLERVVRDAAGEALDSGRCFLGICVGMQMLFDSSEENPGTRGLGLLPGEVRWIGTELPRPQMQWNQLEVVGDEPLFRGLGASPWMYFVHSLHAVPAEAGVVTATVDYGASLTAAVRRGHLSAVQFHPEKSSSAGLALLANFVADVRASSAGGR